jgi:hypothetical protein
MIVISGGVGDPALLDFETRSDELARDKVAARDLQLLLRGVARQLDHILGSMEFACKLSGAKVVLVMGHTACGAIKCAIDNAELGNLTGLLAKIKPAVQATTYTGERSATNYPFVDAVARKNVELTVVKQDANWWIGWIEEVPGVNCQESTREELLESLRVNLAEAIAFNRMEARRAAGKGYEELSIAV